jgi:hypothetical protein
MNNCAKLESALLTTKATRFFFSDEVAGGDSGFEMMWVQDTLFQKAGNRRGA